MTELKNNSGIPGNPFGKWDYLKITILVFATTGLWQSLHSLILPIRILDFVPEPEKNTYLGLMTFVGLIIAMLLQPVFGAISDRSGFRLGKRRPFIIIGVLCLLLFLPGTPGVYSRSRPGWQKGAGFRHKKLRGNAGRGYPDIYHR